LIGRDERDERKVKGIVNRAKPCYNNNVVNKIAIKEE